MGVSVSVVIPTTGDSPFIRKAIGAFVPHCADPALREVAVVQNGRFDRLLRDYVESLHTLVPTAKKISFFHEPEASLLAGRHRGIFETTGEIVAFVDDDSIVSMDWLEALKGAFLDSRQLLATGPTLPSWEEPPPKWILGAAESKKEWGGWHLNELSIQDFGDQPIRDFSFDHVWGLNFVIRRDVLMEAGGFHPDISASHLIRFIGDGESALAKRVHELGKGEISYHPGLRTTHCISADRLRFSYFWQVNFRNGMMNQYSEIRSNPKSKWHRSVTRAFLLCCRAVLGFVGGGKPTRHSILRPLARFAGRAHYLVYWRLDPRVRDWVSRENYWDFVTPVRRNT